MKGGWKGTRGVPLQAVLALLQAAPGSQGGRPGARQHQHGGKSGERWTCARCSFENFSWRKECFKCKGTVKRNKAQHTASPKAPGRGPAPPQALQATATAEPAETTEAAEVVEPRRAPEEVRADAFAKATLLEEAAAKALEAGCEEQAEDLKAKAAEQRKRASKAELTPSKRLASLEEWLKRAEKRLENASADVGSAEKALKTAKERKEQLEKEVNEGRERAAALRNEVAGLEDIAEPGAATLDSVEQQLQQLREQLTQARSEATTLRAESDRYFSEGQAQQSRAEALQTRADAQAAVTAEAEQLRSQLTATTAERDALRESTGASFGEGKPTDVTSLELELVRVQNELGEAKGAGEVQRYADLAQEHVDLSRCLVRAVKLRRRS